MATQPRFVRDQDDNWKIQGYFESGRYHFTLSPEAERLLQRDLGYYVGDPVPIEFFRTLVYAGDAWLPSFPDEPVEAGDDLVEPPAPDTMTDEEAEALADHLRGRRVGGRQLSALKGQIDRTPLGRYLTTAALRETDDWIEHLPAMKGRDRDERNAGGRTGASESTGADGKPTPERDADSTSVTEPDEERDGSSGDSVAVPPPNEGYDGLPPAEERSVVESASGTFLAELERADPGLGRFSTQRLVDLYTMLSHIESRVGDVRTDVRDVLAERVREGEELSGRVGTVEGGHRTRRSLKDEEEVVEIVERHGFPRGSVYSMQLDEDAVDDVMEKVDADESAFYEVDETDYVQRTDLDVSQVRRLAGREVSGAGDGTSDEETGADGDTSGEVVCPVDGCSYRGEPSSVAGHISGTHDADHDWSKLSYSGRMDFVADR